MDDSTGICTRFAFGNGIFVAVADAADENDCGNNALTSADGASWNQLDVHNFPTHGPIGEAQWAYPGLVAFGNGRFVAADPSGDVWTSLDGYTWQNSANLDYTGHSFLSLIKLVYANHTFLLMEGLGSDGGLFSSPDGVSWAVHYPPAWLNTLIYANGSYIGVGDNGTILQSDAVPPASTSFDFAVRAGAAPELILSADPGRAFRIEYRTDLGPSDSWQVLTNLYPTTSPFSWQDTQAPSARQRFYRAFMLP